MPNALVTGAGGFIGGHLVERLLDEGYDVVGLDIKDVEDWWKLFAGEPRYYPIWRDAADPRSFRDYINEADEVYHLAEDMGGMGFLAGNELNGLNQITMHSNLFRSLRDTPPDQRIFFASSACVYPEHRQDDVASKPLAEIDAYPAHPDLGYGWSKLYAERLLRAHHVERGVSCRIARYHNVYGPYGTWDGGREKAPAAICRKVAIAKLTGKHEIEIWGDGRQERSFMWIGDCIEGTRRLMKSNWTIPTNIGSAERVSINDLVSEVEAIAYGETGTLKRIYIPGPQGVRGRSSDNTLAQAILDWEPSTSLHAGLIQTYAWIYDRVKEQM